MPPLARLRTLLILCLGSVSALGLAAETAPDAPVPTEYARVEVEPAKTSIYIGSVSLRMPIMERAGGSYRTTYVAKVRPYFFYSEHGELEIDFDAEQIARLRAGERVTFTGRARNNHDHPREITGHADPIDATSGRIKVRVRVSRKIELIFNTDYRFTGPSEALAGTPANERL